MIQPAFRFGCFLRQLAPDRPPQMVLDSGERSAGGAVPEYGAQPRVICPHRRNVTSAGRLVVCRPVAALTLARTPPGHFFAE
jgi:hypothetical protein